MLEEQEPILLEPEELCTYYEYIDGKPVIVMFLALMAPKLCRLECNVQYDSMNVKKVHARHYHHILHLIFQKLLFNDKRNYNVKAMLSIFLLVEQQLLFLLQVPPYPFQPMISISHIAPFWNEKFIHYNV